jgi:hypothetical protein
MTKIIHLLLLSILALCGSLLAYFTENVHIVIIDGARYSETFGDSTHQNIPFIWTRLKPKSTIYTRFYNDSLTYTTAGHASIISGVWQIIANDDSQRPSTPTLFEYFRKERKTNITDNFVILGKDKLQLLASSFHPEYGGNYCASVVKSVSQYSDKIAWENFKHVLSTYHPRLTITNLPQVDSKGHNGDWEGYLHAIRLADSITYEMWNLIQSDSFYKDKTTLIVTNDHGRHLVDWTSHGDGCDGCRHLMMMMLGPDTKAGVIDSVRRTQIDIAPTVGELLNFSTPLCKGTSIIATKVQPSVVLLEPQNGAIVNDNSIKLEWSIIPNSGVDSFYIQIASDPLMTNIVFSDTTTLLSVIFKVTKNKGIYWWHVKPHSIAASEPWTATREFTVDIKGKTGRPEQIFLNFDQNHKTGSSLVLKYGLPASTSVLIGLYSLNGTLVRTLFKGTLQSDFHTLTINDLSISSGHYMLDFIAGQYRTSRRFFVY